MSIKKIKGNPEHATSCDIGIVVARWNSFITDELLDGAVNLLHSQGYADNQLTVVYCPGAFEIPLTAQKILPEMDGVIALGAVIRGETPHFDYVCKGVTDGILSLNLEFEKPVSFGVLTTDTVKQAQERAGLIGEKGNKGAEAALALLEMIDVGNQITNLS